MSYSDKTDDNDWIWRNDPTWNRVRHHFFGKSDFERIIIVEGLGYYLLGSYRRLLSCAEFRHIRRFEPIHVGSFRQNEKKIGIMSEKLKRPFSVYVQKKPGFSAHENTVVCENACVV